MTSSCMPCLFNIFISPWRSHCQCVFLIGFIDMFKYVIHQFVILQAGSYKFPFITSAKAISPCIGSDQIVCVDISESMCVWMSTLVMAYIYFLRVNCDKIMHARWDFDASNEQTRRWMNLTSIRIERKCIIWSQYLSSN